MDWLTYPLSFFFVGLIAFAGLAGSESDKQYNLGKGTCALGRKGVCEGA